MAYKWTAVDRETGELYEFSSRAAMRQFVRENPTVAGRERASLAEALHLPPGITIEEIRAERRPKVPMWHAEQWTYRPVTMKREREALNPTAGLQFAFLKALTSKDPESAARIYGGWNRLVKGYVEGEIGPKHFTAGMADLVLWLTTTPYAPPVPIHYHVGNDNYNPEDIDFEPDDGGEIGEDEELE